MKPAIFRILVLAIGALFLLAQTEPLAARGGRGGGGRGGGGDRSYSRAGGMGGGGRGGGYSRPSVSGGGYRGGGTRTAQRPSGSRSNRAGGMAPNRNVNGGNINRSQASSKIQSRPKGSASALPSVGQGKNAGIAAGGNKGFPDVGGRGGAGQLAGKGQGPGAGQLGGRGQGAGGGQLAGKGQGPGTGQLGGRGQGAGGGQLAGRGQGAGGGRLEGAQGGQLGGKLQGAQGGQVSNRMQGIGAGLAGGAVAGGIAGGIAGNLGGGDLGGRLQGGDLGGRFQGGERGQLGNNLSPERRQAVADRQQYWNNWSNQNRGKVDNFRNNRTNDWNNINNFRKNENIGNRFNSDQWNNYRNNVNNFRNNRATEINNSIQNNFDGNFDDNWWGNCGWYGGGYWGGNPWWWWGATTLATAGTFLAIDAMQEATYQPSVYDYGVNVVYQGDDVYVDGKRTAGTTEYTQQAVALANEPATQPPAPAPPQTGQQPEWLPLGVWALAQEEKGDAYMFFQISISKDGVVSGAYQNVLSGEKSPISGQVDKQTQRVAWKIDTNGGTNNTVIETGLQNLTQDVASCLVHFGPNSTQTWLLVRQKQPEMPNVPQTAEAGTKGS